MTHNLPGSILPKVVASPCPVRLVTIPCFLFLKSSGIHIFVESLTLLLQCLFFWWICSKASDIH